MVGPYQSTVLKYEEKCSVVSFSGQDLKCYYSPAAHGGDAYSADDADNELEGEDEEKHHEVERAVTSVRFK